MTAVPGTVAELVRWRVERGDHPLLVSDAAVLTYADAERRSAELACGLLASGVGPGTHVGLLHPNGPGFVVGWLAAARIGAVTVPLSTFSTADELRVLLRSGDVHTLVATPEHRGRSLVDVVQEAVPGWDPSAPVVHDPTVPALRGVVPDQGSLAGALDDERLRGVEALVTPADRLVIVHTSGSTSAPKGVIHQHGPLLAHVAALSAVRPLDEEDVLFSPSPFFWIGGLGFSLLATMLAGSTLVDSDATDAGETLDLLERTRPTVANGFAAAAARLVEHPSFPGRDLSSIRRGNLWPLLPPDIRPADPDLRHNLFGMSETGSVCLGGPTEVDLPERNRGSFGLPVPGVEARVVDPGSGADVEHGAVGELWLRGPNLFEGYVGRERHETFTPDGWFRTGDLFSVDEDGFHHFHGRRGDMIKTSGANVSPREVEAAIAAATGLAAHVVGVPDERRGEVVAAVVRVRAGQDPPAVDELRAELRRRLSSYKVPRRFLVLPDDQVPMLSTGKVDARALRALLTDA